MKWSQQNNTPKHNYFIGSKNNDANHAKEGDNKIDLGGTNRSFSVLIS